MVSNQPKINKKKTAVRTVLTALLILAVAAGGALWFAWTRIQVMLGPVSDSQEQILVTVPRGATSAQVGKILQDAGLIHNSTLFRFWVRYHDLDAKIQAGDYVLTPSMRLEEIVDKLVQGDVHRETVRFTIPEGLFITDIAARLAKKGIVDQERFLELAADVERWQGYWFVQELPAGLEQPLEGYLFPDTYEIFADEENKEELIITLMLNRFKQVFTDEMRERAAELGMSVHQVVTLASIVEKEAVVDHERPLIAGVFHNRLAIREPLGSCATINYILGDFSIRYLTTEQTRIPSPYNTYINQGLPPGPIAAPGKRALEATLWPEETDYLFFVAKDDGSGEHYFARTNAEHEANKAKAKANRNRKK